MWSLKDLLLEVVRPSDFSLELYQGHLAGPGFFAREEVVRLLTLWPELDSPRSICRVYCVLKHLKNSLKMDQESLGSQMLVNLEGALPGPATSLVNLHAIGFSCLVLAYDLYLHTLNSFYLEKNVDLDPDTKRKILEAYLLAIYHLGRSPSLGLEQQRTILSAVHDSLNTFYCYPQGLNEVTPDQFNRRYEEVVQDWVRSSGEIRVLSPSYALVRSVFNMAGLNSPAERMACASMLEASAGHILELSEVFIRSEPIEKCGVH